MRRIMKKQYIIGIAILLLVAAGCNKSSMFKGSEPVHLDDAKTLTFKVSAQGIQAVKSHFADNASAVDGEEASLVWDETDAIGVIAVPFNPEIQDYDFDLVADVDHVCIAAYAGTDDHGNAIFASTETNPSWWAAKGTGEDTRDYTTDESLYGIFAYYPAHEKTPFKLRAENLDVYSSESEGLIVDHVYAPMSHIPWKQDGVSYNQYQILYDTSHIPVIGDIDQSVLISAKDLKDNKAVTLDSFKPVNAMLRFRVNKTADSTIESIDSLRVSAKSDFYEEKDWSDMTSFYNGVWATVSYYYNSSYLNTVGISGTAIPPLMFSKQCQNHIKKLYYDDEGEEGWEDYEELMNRAVVSANSNLIPYMEGLYIGDVKTNPSVSAQFASPLSVSTEATGDYHCLVLYPTFNFIFDEDNTTTVIFEAFSGGKRVMMAEKELPESGFLPGYRYNFTITLGEGVTLEGSDAGSYTLVDEIPLVK